MLAMGSRDYDLAVIGSGPAGQRAAIAAAKLGKRVAIFDRADMLGGVCLHTGTIPSKTLREAVLYLTADVFEGVKVLSHQDELEHVASRRSVHSLAEILDAVTKTVDDRLALARDTDTMEAVGLGLAFGLLHQQDLVGFALLFGRLAQSLSGVDLVHRLLDAAVRIDVVDQ